jgi:hypothetical protein
VQLWATAFSLQAAAVEREATKTAAALAVWAAETWAALAGTAATAAAQAAVVTVAHKVEAEQAVRPERVGGLIKDGPGNLES